MPVTVNYGYASSEHTSLSAHSACAEKQLTESTVKLQSFGGNGYSSRCSSPVVWRDGSQLDSRCNSLKQRLIKYKPQITHAKKKKSKSLDAPREFMKCVPNLLQLIDTHARIDMDAKLMIGDILNQMCKQVVAKTHELALANKANILESQDVISAVYACMSSNLAKHAIAEGARNALLFINNTTKYKAEDFAYRAQRQGLREDPAVGNLIGEITEPKNNKK
ncbi:hypothetical protein TNCV_1077241 [Trichonephila clavipes]|uniref:Histone H2A/H2B/H3 domain-containing protein n=1 Tax=Trichonephila clavipes TaxID=2585209 RepID=A0A8X6V7I7_TRICX|nr:hypothetical protein TNCV_1077241 [Trichonephila clavipes]